MKRNIFRLLLSAVLMMCCMSAWADGDWTILEQPTCSKYGTMQNPDNKSELRLVPKLAHHFVNGKCTVCSHAAPTMYNGTPATSLVTITEDNYATYGLTEKNKSCVMGWKVISTAEEFMKYMNNNNDDGIWIAISAFLTEDIILNKEDNLPQVNTRNMAVVFDGTGHTISNMYRSGTNDVGLFGDYYGIIRNLGLISPKIKVSLYYGGCICGMNHGLIENCFVIDGYIEGTDSDLYGIASQTDGTIKNSYAISNKGNIGRTRDRAGTLINSFAATSGNEEFYVSTLAALNGQKVNGISWYIDVHSNSYPVMMSPMAHHPATVTCTEDGMNEYWHCTACNKYFLDANHTQETTLQDLTLSALGHNMEHVSEVEATCEATGNIEHYHCDRCGKNFEEEEGTNKIVDIVIPINPQNHPSELQHVDRAEATCAETGNIAHYHCGRCGKNFEDKDGAEEIDDVGIPIDSNNHNLSLKDGKAHCEWCNQDISGFVATNDKPVSLTKENDEYFLKADFVLDGGVNYLADVDFIVNGTFTYRRNVSAVKAGAWQCWYEPFDVELTTDVLTKMDVAEVAGVLLDNEVNTVVAFRKIETGWIKANTPYVFRPKDAILTMGHLELTMVAHQLCSSEETTFYNMSTYDKFTFGGNYKARHNDSWYTLNTSGQFQKMGEGVYLKGQRFWMTIEARDGIPYEYGGIADAKESIDFTVLGDDEPTGIENPQPSTLNPQPSLYNLNGQRVNSIQKGQIYIMNGKKYYYK